MTPSMEDYLEEIYRLGGTQKTVGTKALADVLGISAASVSEMLGRLDRENLVNREPYKGITLTQEGIERAEALLKRHRLWEVFLVRCLDYSWSEAHEDAELLEHLSPRRLTERIDKFLNYPTHCPHGHTIPRSTAIQEETQLVPLISLNPGDKSRIRRVTEEKELLDYLQNIGIKISSSITLIAAGAYEGPLTLDMEGTRIQISYKAASQIYVDMTDAHNTK